MTMDGLDFMIAGDDAEVAEEIRSDAMAYVKHLADANTNACVRIEKKYGLFGLTPEMVSKTLAEMVMA